MFAYTLSHLFRSDDDRCHEIDLEGIKVGKLVKDIRFEDDQGMVAASEGGLKKRMDGFNRTAKECDIKVTIKRTEFIITCLPDQNQDNLLPLLHSYPFIHYRHLYSASSRGATQRRSQPQHDQIKPP